MARVLQSLPDSSSAPQTSTVGRVLSTNTTDERNQRINQGLPVGQDAIPENKQLGTPAVPARAEPTRLGTIIRDATKFFARGAISAKDTVQDIASTGTSAANAGFNAGSGNKGEDVLPNVPMATPEKPVKSKYFGDLYPWGYGKDINPEKTPVRSALDSISQGAQAGTFFAGGAETGEIKNIAEQTGKQFIKSATKEGAVLGGAQGAATGIEEASTAKTPTEGVGDVVKDVAIGIPTGAITGAVGSKIIGAIKPKVAQEVLDSAIKDVSPTLSKTEKEAAAVSGRGEKTGIFGKVEVKPDQKIKDAADAVKDIISNKKTYTEKINAVRDSISKEAESLKAKIKSVDHPYTFKELSSKISNLKSPISIKGTAFEKQTQALKKAVLDIAKEKGGNISGLLDTRKEFDALVQKEYPNLFDKENAPMRNAVTAMRNEINNFIEKQLPGDVSYKNSLKLQSNMYNAIDGMGDKAGKEIGTNKFLRVIKNNPKASTAIGTAASVIGGEKIYERVKKFTGN